MVRPIARNTRDQGNPIDIQRESNGQLSLVFDYRVDAAPQSSVSLGVQCGTGCSGAMPIEEQLRKAPRGQWQQLKVLLQCFEKRGANMRSVSGPLAITSNGSLKLSIGDVHLDTGLSDAIACIFTDAQSCGCSNASAAFANHDNNILSYAKDADSTREDQ